MGTYSADPALELLMQHGEAVRAGTVTLDADDRARLHMAVERLRVLPISEFLELDARSKVDYPVTLHRLLIVASAARIYAEIATDGGFTRDITAPAHDACARVFEWLDAVKGAAPAETDTVLTARYPHARADIFVAEQLCDGTLLFLSMALEDSE